MNFALEPHSAALAAFVATGAPADYRDAPSASCVFLTARDGDRLAGAVAVERQADRFSIVGMQMTGCAAHLEAAFHALEVRARGRGVTRIEFAAETDAIAAFAERMGMRVRAVFYVKELG